jgi:hypothetical protein
VGDESVAWYDDLRALIFDVNPGSTAQRLVNLVNAADESVKSRFSAALAATDSASANTGAGTLGALTATARAQGANGTTDPARVTMVIPGDNNDLTFTAKTNSGENNDTSIIFINTGRAANQERLLFGISLFPHALVFEVGNTTTANQIIVSPPMRPPAPSGRVLSNNTPQRWNRRCPSATFGLTAAAQAGWNWRAACQRASEQHRYSPPETWGTKQVGDN